jgi:hypothetical protein
LPSTNKTDLNGKVECGGSSSEIDKSGTNQDVDMADQSGNYLC